MHASTHTAAAPVQFLGLGSPLYGTAAATIAGPGPFGNMENHVVHTLEWAEMDPGRLMCTFGSLKYSALCKTIESSVLFQGGGVPSLMGLASLPSSLSLMSISCFSFGHAHFFHSP